MKRRILERIAETQDGHHCLRTKAGAVREGWIIRVGNNDVTFANAPSPFDAAPSNETIDLADLAAWMDENGRWIDF